MSRESLEYWKHFLSRIDKHLHTDYDSGKPHQTLLNAQHLPEDGDILPDYDKIERPVVDPWTGRDNPSNPVSSFKAPEATEIERPSVPNYGGEAYERRIEVYRDAYYDPNNPLVAPDANFAERITKDLAELDSGSSVVTAENAWVINKLKECPHVLHTLTFVAGEHAILDKTSFQGYPYDQVEVTVTSDNPHFHFKQWSDGVTANPRIFSIGRYDQIFTAQMEEDPKYTLNFGGGDHCVCSPFVFTGYTNDTVDVNVIVGHNAYKFVGWDDGGTGNPRTFTVGTQSEQFEVVVEKYPCVKFEYDSASSNTISLTYGADMEISTDELNFTSWDKSETSVSGTSVWVRGKSGSTHVADFGGNFTVVSGELMSLVDYTDTSITPVDAQFHDGDCGLFGISWGTPSASSLRDASGLIGPSVVSSNCLFAMFSWNKAIERGPVLPAETLAASCYQNMFYQCSNLHEIQCYATDISASSCTYSWTPNVSATGDFYGKSAANWPTGNAGIPPGWTPHFD